MSKKNSLYKLDMLILASLYHKDCYGYEISKNLKQLSNEIIDIKDGVMYPILYKLLKNEYISTYEQQVGKKIRVYYHIEKKGHQYLINTIDEYYKMLDTIENIIEGIIK